MRCALFVVLALALAALAAAEGPVTVTQFQVQPDSLQAHRTSAYRLADPGTIVARRGLPVTFTVQTSEAISPKDLRFTAEPELDGATMRIVSGSDTDFVVEISTTVQSSAGQFQLGLFVSETGSIEESSVTYYPFPFYLLFNPYNSEDSVHMDENQLKEYIENEYGTATLGSADNYNAIPWFYAQFEESSLQAAMHILSTMKASDAKDPILVSRYFSYFSSYQESNPEGGLLMGNWGERFPGGKAPWEWKGSDEILSQYVSSGFQTVKYGQCWVFSGVLNTLLRTVGIPSRQLVTFSSGHETPDEQGRYSHVIAEYYDRTSGRLVYRSGSVWNFHSWNDAWIARADPVPSGWQAVDATPQEQSDGVFQMGPASVQAVQRRVDDMPYDNPFVISEVAAELQKVLVECPSRRVEECKIVKVLSSDNTTIGQLILTAMPGGTPGKDTAEITWSYKQKRASALVAAEKAAGVSLRLTAEPVAPGKPITLVAELTNAGPVARAVQLTFEAWSILYTGDKVADLKTINRTVTPQPGETQRPSVTLAPEQYARKNAHVAASAVAVVLGTDDVLADRVQLHVPAPALSLAAPATLSLSRSRLSNVHVDGAATVSLTFVNPLPTPLNNVRVHIRGLGGVSIDEVVQVGTIRAAGTYRTTRRFKPLRAGRHFVVASLESDELAHVVGHAEISITH